MSQDFSPMTASILGLQAGVTLSLTDMGVLCGIFATILSVPMLLIRLIIKNAIGDAVNKLRAEIHGGTDALREALTEENRKTYARRELIGLEITELRRRVAELERRMEALEREWRDPK